MGYSITVLPFTFQSGDLTFSQWISIFTLALAPLIAHVIAGAPNPSYLSPRPIPAWHDSIVLYNPTSILWRYAAIADRRIRARTWSPSDLAASNALFWTSHGWDGSEEIVTTSLPYCTQLPRHTRSEFLSWDTISTIIITLQGLQALYVLIAGFNGTDEANKPTQNQGGRAPSFQDGVDVIFTPLAIIGCFRLFAAVWLTSDFSYTDRDPLQQVHQTDEVDLAYPSQYSVTDPRDAQRAGEPTKRRQNNPMTATDGESHSIYMSLLSSRTDTAATAHQKQRQQQQQDQQQRFRPTSYWPSILFRAIYIGLVLCLWIIALFRLVPIGSATSAANQPDRTVTIIIQASFYLFLLTASSGIYLWYFFFAKRPWGTTTTSTGTGTMSVVLPCINTVWYKIYTVLMFLFLLIMFAVACCETARMQCGQYTSLGMQFWNGRTDCANPQ